MPAQAGLQIQQEGQQEEAGVSPGLADQIVQPYSELWVQRVSGSNKVGTTGESGLGLTFGPHKYTQRHTHLQEVTVVCTLAVSDTLIKRRLYKAM